jgi:hypothetical protein
MILQTPLAILGVAALACAGWTAASAQQGPAGYVPPPNSGPSNRPPPIGQGLATPSRGLRPTRNQCFWRDAQSGGPFGSSGTCPAASSAVVGSVCHCWRGRPHTGRVMSMGPYGPPQTVR